MDASSSRAVTSKYLSLSLSLSPSLSLSWCLPLLTPPTSPFFAPPPRPPDSNQFVVKHQDGRTFSTGQLPLEGKEVAKVPSQCTPPKPKGGERLPWRSKSFADEGAMLAGTASETDDSQASGGERVRETRIARGGGQPDLRADQKAARVAWSPSENLVAVANLTGVYLFNS
jgi:hypothetical protein